MMLDFYLERKDNMLKREESLTRLEEEKQGLNNSY